MRISLVPRRNVNQPRQVRKTVEQQLGLPAKALNIDVHDGSLGVESLFDAEALAAFEHKLKNGIVDIDHPHPAMQDDQNNNDAMQDPAQATFHGLASDLEQFYPTAPAPNNPGNTNLNFHTEKITPPYTPTWRTTHRNSNK